MGTLPSVTATVMFLRTEEGGRRRAPSDDPRYMPHLVVGDPNQRLAIVGADNVGREEYLGVRFAGSGASLEPGRPHVVELTLLYHPDVDYAALKPGTTFTIREGPQVVGFGEVVSRGPH